MKRIFIISLVFSCVCTLCGNETEQKDWEVAVAYKTLEALAAGEADGAELEKIIFGEFTDITAPELQYALAMTALAQGIKADGAAREEFLLRAYNRFSGAVEKVEEPLKSSAGIELARTLFLLADNTTDARRAAGFCGRAFVVLRSLDELDRAAGIERDTLLYLLCAKTGFVSGMEEYRNRIDAAGGDTGSLPVYSTYKELPSDEDMILKKDPSDRGYTLEDRAGTFTAMLYLLPVKEYGNREKYPEYLKNFASPVLPESLEGQLDICAFAAADKNISGVYGTLTDRKWQPGDNKKGSRQYVTIALMGGTERREVLYMVLFSDFQSSAKLDRVLNYSSSLVSGK